jgi:hypothetical protein
MTKSLLSEEVLTTDSFEALFGAKDFCYLFHRSFSSIARLKASGRACREDYNKSFLL